MQAKGLVGMVVEGKPMSRENWGREKSRCQSRGLRRAAAGKEKWGEEGGKHIPTLGIGQYVGLQGARGRLWPASHHRILPQMGFSDLHRDLQLQDWAL